MEFIYKEILIPGLRKPLFRATRKDTGKDVVVKFVSHCGAEVHQTLADCNLAPDIYAHMAVGAMIMVIMEYSEGEWWPEHPSAQQKKNLQAIAAKLESTGFVHGDLRTPNILVQGDSVLVVDFDWAGRQGAAKYPIHLSQEETWHPDACVGCAIEHSHDFSWWPDCASKNGDQMSLFISFAPTPWSCRSYFRSSSLNSCSSVRAALCSV